MNTENNIAYLQHGEGNGPFRTEKVEVKYAPMPHHVKGLSYTSSGYGSRIPSPHMVKYEGRWYRVYIHIFSNSGTCYIVSRGEKIIVQN